MATTWYFIVALILSVYVALDGIDIGVGLLHLWVAKTEREREQTMRSIGPIWDGNEVWLIAGGGVLLAVFPLLYATLFSGFYLALMAVLWLLLFRALSIELRHQIHDALWWQFWDVAFCVSSLLIAALFGFALGNLVRGVSLDEKGNFFTPLWTDFDVGSSVGIIDWYTTFIALSALLAVAFHGALWLSHRTDGDVQERAARLTLPLSYILFAASLPITLLTAYVQPQLLRNLLHYPLSFIALSCLAFGGMLGAWYGSKIKNYRFAFRGSCLFLVSMVVSAAFGVYPQALAGRDSTRSLGIEQCAAPDNMLLTSLYWFVPGIALAASYTYLAYRRLPRVFSIKDED